MFQKMKDYIKKDWKFMLLILGFMLLNLIIVTINYSTDCDGICINGLFKTWYSTISVIMIIVLGGFLAFKVRNADKDNIKLEKLYLWVAIPIGLIMCFNTPLGKVPDEDDHCKKAMAISQGNFFSVADENGNAIEMINAKVHEFVTRTVDNYDDALRRATLPETEEKIPLKYNTMALYAPICHAPQAFGIFITRLFGAGITVQCYAGRLVNFAVGLVLLYNAIRLIPFKKYLVTYLALLPVAFNVLPSMSSDTLTIGMSFFYIAYILHLKYNEEVKEITKKDKVALTISTLIISLCKIVYIPLCILLLIIPKEKYGSLKKKNVFTIIVIIAAIALNLIWLGYCSRFLIEFNTGVNSKEQVLFILTHPIDYIMVLARTINFYFNTYYAGLSGDALGSYTVKASEIYICATIGLTSILMLGNIEGDKKVKIDWFTRLIAAMAFIAIVLLIYTSLYVQWNPYMNPLINGVQPRYFFPIIFLTSLIIDNDLFVIKKKINRFILTYATFFNINVATATIYTYYFGVLINTYIK